MTPAAAVPTTPATAAPPPADLVGAAGPLTGRSFAELAAIFDALPHPAAAPCGELRGRAVALAGAQRLPRPARRSATRVLAGLIAPVWRGKRLAADGGVNRWLPLRSPLAFAHFASVRAADGALLLDYDVPQNPRPLRRIVGELRSVAPGRCLGRMDVAVGARRHTVLFFTLEG